MKEIRLKESEQSIDISPECCSFYIAFGVSLFRTLIYTKSYPHLAQPTWQGLETALIHSRPIAIQYKLLDQFATCYQLLRNLNDRTETESECLLKERLTDQKVLQAIEGTFRCILTSMFPDECKGTMACEAYEVTHTHIQALCDILSIHLSLVLHGDYETYFCNRSTAVVVYFYKSGLSFAILRDCKQYQMYYTHKPSIPETVVSLVYALAGFIESPGQSALIAAVQRATAECPELLKGSLRTITMNNLPNASLEIVSFNCDKCKLPKNEVLFGICRNQCKLCSFCVQENRCAACDSELE